MVTNRKLVSSRLVAGAIASFAFVAAGFSACGGSTSSVSDDGGTAGGDSSTSDGSSGSDSGKTGDGSTSSSACPSPAPADGSSCTENGLQCEYGDFIQLACDRIATCTSGAWSVTIPSDCHNTDVDAAACPATESDVPNGDACTDLGLTCAYASGVCYCTVDHSGAPQVWTCFPTTGCPYPRPRLGDACTSDGLQCDYSTCGASVQCTGGTWHEGNGGCHP